MAKKMRCKKIMLFVYSSQAPAPTPGRLYSRSQLMDRIYPNERVVSGRTIDSHVKKLRRKIAAVSPDEDLIRSVYGVGYKFEAPPRAG